MQTVSHKQEMKISTLNGYFPLLIVFFKINRVQAVDEQDLR